jgi:hypothetical protein
MEIRPAPNLPGWRLCELHAGRPEFFEQSMNIGDFNGSDDQGNFPRGRLGEIRLLDETKMQADGAARNRPVERRYVMKKVDLKSKFHSEECGTIGNVLHEQDRDDRLQDDFARGIPSIRRESRPGHIDSRLLDSRWASSRHPVLPMCV